MREKEQSMSGQVAVVTGANGYIAGHIIKQLLDEDVQVIGTVRSFDRAAKLRSNFAKQVGAGQLSFLEVDLDDNESIARIFETHHNITRFFHPAQNFGISAKTPKDLDREIIQHTVKTLDYLIDLVENSDSPIERFVYFSSSVAIRGCDVDRVKVFTEDDFADLTHNKATISWMNAYAFAKVQGEKKILSFKSKRNIEYKIIVPPTVIGPPVCPWNGPDEIDPNNKNLFAVFKGQPPTTGIEWYADVRNIADAAVQASDRRQTPGTTNNRYVIVDGTNTFYDAISIFLKHFRINAENLNIWGKLAKKGKEVNENRKLAKRDFSITESEINHKEIPFEKTVLDTVDYFCF